VSVAYMTMKWKKAPEESVSLLAQRMESANCEYRKMFVYRARALKLLILFFLRNQK
jgi:hypothetical protein